MSENPIFRAVVGIVQDKGYDALSYELIAARGGVSESDLTAKWPTISGLALEALRTQVGPELIYPDTGDFRSDMRTQLAAIARVFTDPGLGPHLARLVGEAQRYPQVSREFLELVYTPNRTAARRRFLKAQEKGQIRDDIDLDAAVDLTFSPFWFRLLLQSGPMTNEYVDSIVDFSLAGLSPR